MIFTRVVNFDDPDGSRNFREECRQLRGRKEVTMEDFSERRSSQANRYYYGAVLKSFQQFIHEHQKQWYQTDELHKYLKRSFLPMEQVIDPFTGEVVEETLARSSKLKVGQFYDYVESIRAWLAEQGCDVPDPSDYGIRDPKKGAA